MAGPISSTNTYGHLTRLAIWSLRKAWDCDRPIQDRLARGRQAMIALAAPEQVEARLHESGEGREPQLELLIAEDRKAYMIDNSEEMPF